MSQGINEKECTKCHTVKPLSEFYVNNRAKDKLTYRCKQCHKLDSKEYYRELTEQCLEAHRQWILKNPEYMREYNIRYYSSHVEQTAEY